MVQPHGIASSVLTMETRRFARYWRRVEPSVRLIDRMTLRLLAAELRRSTPTGTFTGT